MLSASAHVDGSGGSGGSVGSGGAVAYCSDK